MKPALGAARLETLDTHTIQRFYNSLIASGLSPKTVKNVHGILHCALQQAIACDYIYRNPADACKLPKVTATQCGSMAAKAICSLNAAQTKPEITWADGLWNENNN